VRYYRCSLRWSDTGSHLPRNADGIVEQGDGSLLFVEPHQTQENFVEFMRYVQEDCAAPLPSAPEIRNVKYAQTRRQYPECNDFFR
jgi:hypothetical protein